MNHEKEVLTKDHFDAWRKEEFIPHTVREEIYEEKVDRLWWTAIASIAVGGVTLALFMWILLQKNIQIENMQAETMRLALNQAGVVKTLEAQSEELKRQQNVDTNLMNVLMEVVKQQSMLHGQNNSFNGGKKK